ncbi:MAG TPA: hypothetical protein VN756_13100 [Solirubrobacterales bacterium]|nr:hypothetical protein [Solirubrobacterales bacterium]
MDYPVRVYGPNVYELVLTKYLAGLGLLLLSWTVAAALWPATLAVASTSAAGLLVGATGAAALAIVLAGAGLRQNRAALDLGFALLAAVAVAWTAAAIVESEAIALVAGGLMVAAFAIAWILRHAAVQARYKPRFFSPRQFETLIQVADTMIDGDGREAIDSVDIAVRVDHLLAETSSPALPQIKLVLILVEWVLPLLVVRPLPFSTLGSNVRRSAVEGVIGTGGFLRPVARTLKVLSCVGYYGNPETMRGLGYVPFDERPRAIGVDQSPVHYPDPFPGPPGS